MTHDNTSSVNDTKQLQSIGYKQELDRRMSGFANFAISFATICIVAGGLTSFHLGFSSVGGAAIGLGWPLACLFSLTVAASMGQLASAFPTAGGLYHWASILGGRGWGWVTAWLNIAGLMTVLAAINVGFVNFVNSTLKLGLGFDPWPGVDPLLIQSLGVMATTIIQATINHRGIRVTTLLTNFSGYLILATSLLLTLSLLWVAKDIDLGRLVQFSNYSGTKGGDVWPSTDNFSFLFCLGLLLPAYTITGFDASAHTAEETLSAEINVPRGIIRSVLISGVAGWVMLAAMVLAMPDPDLGAQQGENIVFWLLNQTLTKHLTVGILIGICTAQFLCGLATVTSASRMLFAFARDGGLPCSKTLRKVSPTFLTPGPAIWTVALLSIGFTLYTPLYSTISVVCAAFLYLSYCIPAMLGFFVHGRHWQEFGPWNLGFWFKPACIVSTCGCMLLLWIGVQAPNEKALSVLLGTASIMAILWFGSERRRFQGPPIHGFNVRK